MWHYPKIEVNLRFLLSKTKRYKYVRRLSVMKIRVADYIISKLHEAGADHSFMVTGGMIMHLTDAVLVNKKMKYTCCHHEQSAAMAADAYGRYTNNLGLAIVTAGPGALNTITGVVGGYVDRAPMIILAGQSKVSQATVVATRQFALQGFNNLPIFKNFTKYAVMLTDVTKVRYEIEKAIYLAKEAPVGPVYIECPIDIQAATFDPEECVGYKIKNQISTLAEQFSQNNNLEKEFTKLTDLILNAKRPIILAGAGVRLSSAINELHSFVEKFNIPIITSRLGMDLIGDNHSHFVGRPGTYGDRPANFAIQNADLFIVIGCRLGMGIIGYGDPKLFAPHAVKIGIDVDEQELNKPGVVYDLKFLADAKDFLRETISRLENVIANKKSGSNIFSFRENWHKQTKIWKEKYPVDLPEYANEKEGINSYHFTRLFSEKLDSNAVVLLDTGSCFHVHAQAFKVKFGQRHIITGGLSTMGYSPASIGVARANEGKDVYCITGDGSIQMNLQEFETIAHNKLPIKTIIYNNNGYLLIRHTQKNFCDGRLIGEGPETGVGFPDFSKIANAFGIHYIRINNLSEFESKINELKNYSGPVICEVINPEWQLLIPRVASKQLEDGRMISMPYDDMFPFLDRDEYEQNCVWRENK